MSTYGQFCPVAKAMEVLDERWTLLVVRELLSGSTHFNELRRGLAKMSPALLSKRLRSLGRVGIIRRNVAGRHVTYEVTPCGQELRPVVESLGAWGVRWIGEIGEEDLDPHLLMWDVRRHVPIDAWPRARTVVRFELSEVARGSTRWWLLVDGGEADVCDVDPGFEVTATVSTGLRTLIEIWRGDRTWSDALRSGAVRVAGSADVRRAVPTWLGQSMLAAVPRPV